MPTSFEYTYTNHFWRLYMLINKKVIIKILDITVCTFISAGIIFALIFASGIDNKKNVYVMGGVLVEFVMDESIKTTANYSTINTNERYFRPSSLKTLNTRSFPSKFYSHIYASNPDPNKINLPRYLTNTSENTVLNYFSILREAENLIKEKTAGCGTVGMAKLPYPAAYEFLSEDYKKILSYESYLKSFEGIGHINLIKMKELQVTKPNTNSHKYFIEVETIEGSPAGNTSFSYYYGFLYLTKEKDCYKISSINLTLEDYLCAPYHGWQYIAEGSVDIRYGDWCKLVKKRLPTEQAGYVKNIYVLGNDNKNYRFEFFQLTNGMDIEIEQYVKDINGKWIPIDIDTDKCLEKNFPSAR